MKARLMPFDILAQRFPRMVRDISQRMGKEIDFQIIGSEIELDRSILEKLGDPLVHLLRNSIDHGIEAPEERQKKGKPRMGKIRLIAEKQQEDILIKIDDDGQGIDPKQIIRVALDKKLLTHEQLTTYSKEDILMLITRSGFSTAAEVSEISGRGVGMDVVKHTIESIGGLLQIDTQPDQGATFILRIPFTIAVIKVLLMSFQRARYAIPINQISKTLEIPASDLVHKKNKLLLSYSGKLIQVFRLSTLLGLGNDDRAERLSYQLIMTEIRGNSYGIIVDDLIGQEEVVVKALNKPLETIRGLSGVTILGDGGVVLILDVFNLI